MLRLILFFLITLNFSCKNDLNSIIDINKFSRSPAAITENFVLKYNCITKSDKNKNPSSFIYEIGQNQMKMRAGDIATLLVDLKSRTYSFEGYKLNEKDKPFLKLLFLLSWVSLFIEDIIVTTL